MHDFERANLEAINSLNQRGGRMLSMVDLLEAGTLNLEMAAEMAYTAAEGGSLLTAAGPGGVGKTTLMAAALGFLAPGTEIVTIEGPETLDMVAGAKAGHPQYLVVHEIGAASIHGYLWGPAVARYFELAMQPGRSLASNLHAETYAAARGQLTGWSLAVTPRALGWVPLLAFMADVRGRRRITELWNSDGTPALSKACGAPADGPVCGHRLAWRWLAKADEFEPVGPPSSETIASHRGGRTAAAVEADLARFRDFLDRAWDDGVERLEDLRRHALAELFGRT